MAQTGINFQNPQRAGAKRAMLLNCQFSAQGEPVLRGLLLMCEHNFKKIAVK